MKARVYAFDEVDRPEEVAAALTELRQEIINEISALRSELEGCVRKKSEKRKKKGFVMKNVLISIAALSVILGSIAYGQFVKTDINYDIASNPESLSQYLRDVVASGTFEFTPISAPTNIDIIEGKMYYDISSRAIFVSLDGITWTQLDTAGGTSLDASYNLGNTIDVDTSALTFTTSNGDNNVVMAIVQNEADNDNAAFTIVFGAGAIGTGVNINSQSGGTDISGDNWNINQAGDLTIVGVVVGTGDLTFSQNGAVILNDTDGQIQFADASEDVSMGFGTSNTLTWTTDTGVDTVNWGDLDAFTGLASITGDSADFTLSITADAGGEDLIIQLLGAVDSSIQLLSAGTGADAIDIETSAGGISIASTGGDTVIDGTNASVRIDAGEASADDAIVIEVTGAASGMRIISLADIDITTTGAAGEDITIANTGGSVILTATEDIATAIVINATTGGIDITADGASASDMDLACTNGSVNITAGEAIANAITIVSTGGVDITSASTFDIDITATGGKVLVVATEAAADQFKVDATGTVSGDAITLETTNGGIMLNADDGTNGDIELNAASELTLTTAGVAILPMTATFEHKYQYIALSAGTVTATEVMVIGGYPLICTGLESGVSEVGATEGYVGVGDSSDVLVFGFTLPADFIDTGVQADLIIEFDIDEQASEEVNIDIRIFEYDDAGNATAIIVDTVVAANDSTRAWKGLVSNSAGIGNEADLNGEESLIIEITANTNGDDFNIYGIRLLYRVGIQALQ